MEIKISVTKDGKDGEYEARLGKHKATGYTEWLAIRRVINKYFNLERDNEQ